MPASQHGPAAPDGPIPSQPFPEWTATHTERVLHALEGWGPASDARIQARTRRTLADLDREVGTQASTAQVCDHLWARLLCAGWPVASRFFRPVARQGAQILWVRRGDGGADGLDRRRVEALLQRLGRAHAGGELDAIRIARQCSSLLHNGLGETELARALSLTSPGQAAILRRLCRGGNAFPVSP
ncbi:hypothetical protein [Thiohalorhabdus sp.]|uniref:hypothetical protein n=1 Tax=Thiohalorhabdus sp. TaxID=3094134 RepID=UPI002FC3D168